MTTRVPRHARRVEKILGYVPKPKYHVVIDNRAVGRWFRLKHPGMGRAFTWQEFTPKGACRRARKEKAKGSPNVEVLECYGSFVGDDCAEYKRCPKK